VRIMRWAQDMETGLYPEHICSDGYPDWGPPEGCPNCDLTHAEDELNPIADVLDEIMSI